MRFVFLPVVFLSIDMRMGWFSRLHNLFFLPCISTPSLPPSALLYSTPRPLCANALRYAPSLPSPTPRPIPYLHTALSFTLYPRSPTISHTHDLFSFRLKPLLSFVPFFATYAVYPVVELSSFLWVPPTELDVSGFDAHHPKVFSPKT
jgi:hypothetical protein